MNNKEASLTASRLLRAFLDGRGKHTRQAYQADLEVFGRYVAAPDVASAVAALVAMSHGQAHALGIEFRGDLIRQGLAPATVNRRLAALRSLVRLARGLGLVSWTLDVSGIKVEPYRDTRGPGRNGFNRLLRLLTKRTDVAGVRNQAALRLLFDLALRREEVVSLDVADVDLANGTVAVLGKGRTQRLILTLPRLTQEALERWLKLRGDLPGPLFTNFDPAGKGRRLTGRSLHRIIVDLGEQAGLRVSPHGLRHAAITEALELTGGNVRAVQRFSRHRDLRILNVYDDCRQDLAGWVAQMVSSGARRRRYRPGAAAQSSR